MEAEFSGYAIFMNWLNVLLYFKLVFQQSNFKPLYSAHYLGSWRVENGSVCEVLAIQA